MTNNSESPKILAVVPTIRGIEYAEEWARVFANHDVSLIVVQDGEKGDIGVPDSLYSCCRDVYKIDWEQIDDMLGEKGWVVSRYDSGIRCSGWLWAKRNRIDFDYVFTFDDDTSPIDENHLEYHLSNVRSGARNFMFNTVPRFAGTRRIYPRGLLGEQKEVVLSHGLWTNVPDVDAETQKIVGNLSGWRVPAFTLEIPRYTYFPMSGMNVLFDADIAPIMYFGLMGKNNDLVDWGIGRWDDMFAGWIGKLWIDHIDKSVVTGFPYVRHDRKSNVERNALLEKPWKENSQLVGLLADLQRLNVCGDLKGNGIVDFLVSIYEASTAIVDGRDDWGVKHFTKCLEAAVIFAEEYIA